MVQDRAVVRFHAIKAGSNDSGYVDVAVNFGEGCRGEGVADEVGFKLPNFMDFDQAAAVAPALQHRDAGSQLLGALVGILSLQPAAADKGFRYAKGSAEAMPELH